MFGALLQLQLREKVLVWFGLMLNVPVNNFSVMLPGRSHLFLGITCTFFFWGGGVLYLICLAQ